MGAGTGRRHPFAAWWPLFFVAMLVAALIAERVLFAPQLDPFTARREMMDTWVSITVYAADETQAKRAAEGAFARMEEVVAVASIYDPDAEAARLNAAGRLDDPSPELMEILEAAVRFFDISRGTFDVTIEPLLALWRFDPNASAQFWELDQQAQQAAILEAMGSVGANRIVVQRDPTAIELAPGMQINLGGIAKGYVVDQGIEALRDGGIEYALIDAGGDIAVIGGTPGGGTWEIALRDPEGEADVLARFALHEGAIATSGNYLRYYDPDAQVGHIMDPRTGYSAHAASSATVIAPSCTEADALATAVFVLGPVDGIVLVDGLTAVEAMVLGFEDPWSIARSQHLGDYELRKKDGV